MVNLTLKLVIAILWTILTFYELTIVDHLPCYRYMRMREARYRDKGQLIVELTSVIGGLGYTTSGFMLCAAGINQWSTFN